MSLVDWLTISRGWTFLLTWVSLLVFVDLNRNSPVAASPPVAERSVKLKRVNDSQVPQGSGLLCQLLQRSCMVGRVGANALVGSELSSNNWWFPSNFCEPYGFFLLVLTIFKLKSRGR